MRLNPGQHALHVTQLAAHRQAERVHRALHALQHVDPQQVNEAFFTIGLPEEALAAADLGAVLRVVRRLLVRQHVPQRCVRRQVQAPDLAVDLCDGPEVASQIDIALEVDGAQAIREATRLGGAVIPLDVAP